MAIATGTNQGARNGRTVWNDRSVGLGSRMVADGKQMTKKQLDAWAPVVPAASFWKERFKKYRVYVAEEEGRIIGFTELDTMGHIDCFFVHHEWQRRGVGTRLMERVVESAARAGTPRLFAEVSITAVPFFRHQDFAVVRENEAVRSNVKLKQFAMERWLTA